jgi:hypothetical protein
MTDFREIFKTYGRLDLCLVPIPRGLKYPVAPGWQLPENRVDIAQIEQHVAAGGNVGFITGDIVDVDLDCSEAIALADIFLPETGAVFGRASKPASHWLYRSPGAVYTKYGDPLSGKMLLELRAPGLSGGCHQTLLPPSTADGEAREWRGGEIEPAEVAAELLAISCAWLAIAALTWRYVSAERARQPDFDLLDLLWSVDRKLGRSAYAWAGMPAPGEKPLVETRHKPPAVAVSQRGRFVSSAALEVIVEAIENDCDWIAWNKVGMSVFVASEGSLHGFAVFDRFSARSPKYDPHSVVERWSNYQRSPPSRLSFGTLVYLAKGRAG